MHVKIIICHNCNTEMFNKEKQNNMYDTWDAIKIIKYHL